MVLTAQQQKKVDGIAAIIKDYLDVRFAHACRVNPAIAHIYADLAWHQMETVRQVLREIKSFGPLRIVVADVFTSDDDAKRRDLFNPADQNTLLNEIVNIKVALKDTTAGILEIKDLRSLYSAFDPSLEHIVELVQTCIWWDLPDAVDLYNFEQQYHRVQALRTSSLTDALVDYYRKVLKRGADAQVTREEILNLEFKRLQKILSSFKHRRELEEGFRIIIKRDELPDAELDSLIVETTSNLEKRSQLEQLPELDEEKKQFYVNLLGCSEEEITPERALGFEERSLKQRLEQLKDILAAGKKLGPPYNYKLSQLHDMEKKFQQVKQTLFPEATEQEPAPSSIT